jgi:hypothetical protein
MADDRSPFERSRRSALTEGAARFDGLARELKTQQIAESQGTPSTVYQPAAVSPDETWARNFMTQGIGPRLELPHVASFAPPLQMPGMSFDLTAPQAIVARPVERRLEASMPIGAQLGKPAPRRSWLGRLLRPKSQGV